MVVAEGLDPATKKGVGMRALRLLAWKSEPEFADVEEPRPGPGQVVVRIAGAGVCHSDLHLMHDFEPGQLPWGPPFTLGHENAGWVHALGEGVTGLAPGQPVAVYGPWGCGVCRNCRVGVETYCENPEGAPAPGGGGGLGVDGGMAELMLVPHARHVVPVPEGLDPVFAAPLTDAGLTPYHAVRRSWPKLVPGSTAVVIGVGGLGHMAVELLRELTPARVLAVDIDETKLRLAAEIGAHDVVRSDEAAADAIRKLTNGAGAEVVLDIVGNDATLALAAAVVRPQGDLSIVGIGGGTLPLSFFAVPFEASVQTTYWGSATELMEVLELARAGRIGSRVTTFGLDQALDAYARLAAGQIEGRAVITHHP